MNTSASLAAPREAAVALAVTLHWQKDLITARHLTGDGAVAIGEAKGALAPIPCDALGCAGLVFARLEGGRARVSVPAGAMATRWSPDGACALIEGPSEEALRQGESLELCVGAFLLRAAASAPEALPRAGLAARARGRGLLPLGFAAVAHALILGLAAHRAMAAEPDAEEERKDELRALLVAAEQRARAVNETVEHDLGDSDGGNVNHHLGNGRAAGGERAAGSAGAMGDSESRTSEHRRYAALRRARNEPEPVLSREAALDGAATFGMIGLLAASAPSVPTPWFGAEETRGADAISARGELWAMSMGSAYGKGGLALTGIGEGGGGRGEGIGLGAVGTLGHGDGPPGSNTGGAGTSLLGGSGWGGSYDCGDGGGIGHGRGTGRIGHKVRAIRWGSEDVSVSGRLPPESIQRIIRQNFGRFRFCYEKALVHTPELSGRVTVRFVIGRDGAVAQVADGGSSMPDPAVVSCVLRAFYGISFPQPEGGIVNVTYPITFSPTP